MPHLPIMNVRGTVVSLFVCGVIVAAGCSPESGGGGASDGGPGEAEDGATPVVADASSTELDGAAAPDSMDGEAGDAGDAGADASMDAGPVVCSAPAWDGPYDLPEGVCSIDGVCQLSTTPINAALDHVWAASANDVWFTGPGITLHWDGVKWRGLTGPTLGGTIAGTGPDNVWIGRLHWNGANLTKAVKPQPGISTWFASANDGWSVDGTTTAHHWDGVDWTPVATGALLGLKAVHGFASNDVWAVGGTSVRHWNGATWSDAPVPLPPGEVANVIGGAAPNDFWVAGSKLFHFANGAWTEPNAQLTDVKAITGNSTNNVLFVTSSRLWRWNGGSISGEITISNQPCQSCTRCLSATTAPDGTRFIGTGIESAPPAKALGCPAFRRTPTSLESIGGNTVLPQMARVVHWNGTLLGLTANTPAIVAGADGAQRPLWGITVNDVPVGLSASSADDVWVTGYYDTTSIASHWDGAAWTYAVLPARPTSAVGAASPSSAWVITGTSTAYWNGAAWVDKGTHGVLGPRAIWGASANDAWVVGGGSTKTIAHWDGVTWSPVAGAPPGPLVEVRGTSTNNVTAVKGTGAIHRWNGATWSMAPGSDRSQTMGAVYAIAPDDIWAATFADPRFLHWDGSCWRTVSTPPSQSPYPSAVGGSAAEVFVVNPGGSQRLVR